MRVDSAAQVGCIILHSVLQIYTFQVLSEQVANALGKNEVSETAKLVCYIDKFFDCFNVTNVKTGIYQKKRFRDPYVKMTFV